MERIRKNCTEILNLHYKYHLWVAFVIRFVLVVYGEFHDYYSEVPYTDVDYKVFTDASRHYYENNSPYDRHTYRYSPLLAVLLVPNIVIHKCFGKVLFSCIDVIVGLLIQKLVAYGRGNYKRCKETIEKANVLQLNHKELKQIKQSDDQNIRRRKAEIKNPIHPPKDVDASDHVPNYCMLSWLYNPMSIIISTRGNCDSIAVFIVLLTLFLLQCKQDYLTAGLVHGLAIHFRLYPIFYSLSYFMYLSKFSEFNIDGKKLKNFFFNEKAVDDNHCLQIAEVNPSNNDIGLFNRKRTIFKKKYLHYLLPNKDQFKLIMGTIVSLTLFTSYFYYYFGYKFLHETYLYHLTRKDTRHNFSLFFYLQYLTAGVKNIGVWQKVLCILPQIILILVLSIRYGLNRFTLHFSILTQTIVMVSYNTVLTSQYFIWILGVMPLVLWQIKMSVMKGFLWGMVWFVAQLAWLLPAYLLEFQGQNTFLFIWLQGVSFFCANMAVLGRLIKCFMYKNEQ